MRYILTGDTLTIFRGANLNDRHLLGLDGDFFEVGGCGVELSMDGGSLMVQVRGGGALLTSVALGTELRGGDYLKTQGAEPTSLGECM
jgi:hypothetical protein